MENLNFEEMMTINGGQVVSGPSPWWSLASTIINAAVIVIEAAAKAYIDYSVETGGKYVIHHAV